GQCPISEHAFFPRHQSSGFMIRSIAVNFGPEALTSCSPKSGHLFLDFSANGGTVVVVAPSQHLSTGMNWILVTGHCQVALAGLGTSRE
ncbi:MAG TPA: hypothetical protein V6C97_01075, partial [Oculatellaceae cyanobacterium]